MQDTSCPTKRSLILSWCAGRLEPATDLEVLLLYNGQV